MIAVRCAFRIVLERDRVAERIDLGGSVAVSVVDPGEAVVAWSDSFGDAATGVPAVVNDFSGRADLLDGMAKFVVTGSGNQSTGVAHLDWVTPFVEFGALDERNLVLPLQPAEALFAAHLDAPTTAILSHVHEPPTAPAVFPDSGREVFHAKQVSHSPV